MDVSNIVGMPSGARVEVVSGRTFIVGETKTLQSGTWYSIWAQSAPCEIAQIGTIKPIPGGSFEAMADCWASKSRPVGEQADHLIRRVLEAYIRSPWPHTQTSRVKWEPNETG